MIVAGNEFEKRINDLVLATSRELFNRNKLQKSFTKIKRKKTPKNKRQKQNKKNNLEN